MEPSYYFIRVGAGDMFQGLPPDYCSAAGWIHQTLTSPQVLGPRVQRRYRYIVRTYRSGVALT
jgi:hypothetical protein